MGKWIVILALLLTSQAQAFVPLASGICHLTTMNKQGAVIGERDLKLTPVNPFNHYGLVFKGAIDSYSVIVELAVGQFDNIGQGASDKVIMIMNGNSASTYHEISGRAFAAGDSFIGSLAEDSSELECRVERNSL